MAKQCQTLRKKEDIKEKMAALLIQHNLLHGKVWQDFHRDIQKVVEKYYPFYEKGQEDWWEEGKINNNI